MAKLSQTDFGTLLELASRADVEQIDDLQHFLSAAPRSRELILKMARKSIVARSIKDGSIMPDVSSKDAVQTEGRTVKIITGSNPAKTERVVKKPRRLDIVLAKGCKMDTPIKYSLERFEKYLADSGFKSAHQYAAGIRGLLRENGLLGATAITTFGMNTMRDRISGATLKETNLRGQLKKFNEYIIFEYTQNN